MNQGAIDKKKELNHSDQKFKMAAMAAVLEFYFALLLLN